MPRTATSSRRNVATKAQRDQQAEEFQREVDVYSKAHKTKPIGKTRTVRPVAPTPKQEPAAPAATPPAFANPRQIHQAIKGGSGGTVAGVALGALGFFTLRAFLTGGWPGVKAFYAAKFLNKTSAAPNPVPAAATTTTTPSTSKTPAGGGTSAKGSVTATTTGSGVVLA